MFGDCPPAAATRPIQSIVHQVCSKKGCHVHSPLPSHSPATPPAARQERELIPSDSPLAPYVSVNPGRMHGEPCFIGTRIPIQTLFDYLEAGDPLSEFLEGFPDITRERAVAVIGLASRGLLEGLRRL